MALLDWSMSMVGHPPHRHSAVPVVACSHMSCYRALRLAEQLGCYTGWLWADHEQPQFEGLIAGRSSWVALAELFVDGRVAETEGLIGGQVVFVPAAPAHGEPDREQPLRDWARALARPWIQVDDNERAVWADPGEDQLDGLLRWFLCAMPLGLDWRQGLLDPEALTRLRHGLFEYGWTRNGELARSRRGGGAEVVLWGGLHGRSVLHGPQVHTLSVIQRGLRLHLEGGRWQAEQLAGPCPLDDERGRLTPAVES